MSKRNMRIAILMNADRAYEQGLLRGILKYSRLHGPWTLLRKRHVVSGGPTQITPSMLRQWQADGIIWREGNTTIDITKLNIPTIYLPYTSPSPTLTNLLTNDAEIGKLAAEHLIDRGLHNFAYYGMGDKYYWSKDRCNAFRSRVEKAGHKLSVFNADGKASVSTWLSTLPRPFGLMVCTDDCCYNCMDACQDTNLRIPEDTAIIGVGNDELVCDFVEPPLSSVVLNTEQAGYEAAQTLARIIEHKEKNPPNIIADPSYIIKRRSTDILAVNDKHIATALKYIRDHSGENIHVSNIVKTVPLSRRALYKHFKQTIGRSIYEEIRRVRIDYAAKMLLETNMSISEIAQKVGFADAKNFARVFRREKNITPFNYRAKNSQFK